jgi:hypothetical protein
MSIVIETKNIVEMPEEAVEEQKVKTNSSIMNIRGLKSFMSKAGHDSVDTQENNQKTVTENLSTEYAKKDITNSLSLVGIKSIFTKGESESKPTEIAKVEETAVLCVKETSDVEKEKSSFSTALHKTGLKSLLMRSNDINMQEKQNEVSKEILEEQTEEKASTFPAVLSVTSLKSFLMRSHDEENIDVNPTNNIKDDIKDKTVEKSSNLPSAVSATNLKAFFMRSHDENSTKTQETADINQKKEEKTEEKASIFSANLSLRSFMTKCSNENNSEVELPGAIKAPDIVKPSITAIEASKDQIEPTSSDSVLLGKI